jgi:hypothetical protein
VDRCYRPEPFPSDRHRVEYLFALYEQLCKGAKATQLWIFLLFTLYRWTESVT